MTETSSAEVAVAHNAAVVPTRRSFVSWLAVGWLAFAAGVGAFVRAERGGGECRALFRVRQRRKLLRELEGRLPALVPAPRPHVVQQLARVLAVDGDGAEEPEDENRHAHDEERDDEELDEQPPRGGRGRGSGPLPLFTF